MTPPLSARYREMRSGITRLRGLLLPSKFDPTGLYTPRVHQKAAAFRLLAHAEFESYLEDVAVQHLQAKLRDWESFGKSSHTLASLMAYDEVAGKEPTSILSPPQKPSPDYGKRLNDAATRFNTRVRVYNHGVRESNILGILLPLGIDQSRIDLIWLAALDSWAKDRGEVAHKSPTKISKNIDPAREYKQVQSLAEGFKTLDRILSGID